MTVYTKSRKEVPSTEQIDNLTESVDELGSLVSRAPATTEAISNMTSATRQSVVKPRVFEFSGDHWMELLQRFIIVRNKLQLALDDPKVQRTYDLPFFEKFRALPSSLRTENEVLAKLNVDLPLAHFFAVEYIAFIKLTNLVEVELKEKKHVIKVPISALDPVIEASEEAPKDTLGRKR